MTCRFPCGSIVSALSLAIGAAAEPGAPLSPVDELATFQFADPGLAAELVAAEPLVSSPVALAWDEAGRLFVAEMRDYPNDRDGGLIRRLEDRDGDGRYETATVFADRLSFPNSVLPWNGGVLVTTAPDLWFLKDTDGDGRADVRRVLFTGFGTGNQQLRANGLLWGLDGWVYGANGRSDGEVRPGDAPAAATVSLRGRDFRFRPDTVVFETLAGRSQFGLGRDDWGNRFLSWNTIPLRHEVIPDSFLARNPRLAAVDPLSDGLPPGDRGEVFPLTPSPVVFNNESGNHFNALSGLHVYRGDALGPDYSGNAFVGESLRNLVHRRVLVPDGPTFRAERRESGREFLAATDPWFHPVGFATGPDGTLYIADFYRRFVEHPDWVAKEMRNRVAWDEGRHHGRIWRVRRRGQTLPPTNPAAFTASSTIASWVGELKQANGWRRDTAQRLLLERRDPHSLAPLTEAIATSVRPESRVAALHTWAALGGESADVLRGRLSDPAPQVRAAAAQIAGNWLAATASAGDENRQQIQKRQEALARPLAALVSDTNAFVRLHAALALGFVADAAVREPALESLINTTTHRWLRLAAASSSQSVDLVTRGLPFPPPSRPPPVPQNSDPDRAQVVSRFEPALRLEGDRRRGAVTVNRLCLSCHYLQGRGQRVGPDLAGASSRSPENLLVDLLDPSRQVAPDYAAYEIIPVNGAPVIALIASETATRITGRHPGGPDESWARADLREMRLTGRSLMPDGLEEGLSAQDVADLLAFLRSPEGELLP